MTFNIWYYMVRKNMFLPNFKKYLQNQIQNIQIPNSASINPNIGVVEREKFRKMIEVSSYFLLLLTIFQRLFS